MDKRGIPYSLSEAKILVQDQGHRIDPYHRELMEFLVEQNEELLEVAKFVREHVEGMPSAWQKEAFRRLEAAIAKAEAEGRKP